MVLRHGLLVAGDRRGGDDDRVARLDRDVAMVAVAHAGQPAHRLTLRARWSSPPAPPSARRCSWSLRTSVAVAVVQVAALEGDRDVLLHAASQRHHLAAVGRTPRRAPAARDRCCWRRWPRSRDPGASPTSRWSALADRRLRQGVALLLGAGRVAQQEVDPAVADLGDQPQVGATPVRRGVVELEVAGVHDRARLGVGWRSPTPSGIEWFTRKGSDAERADRELRPGSTTCSGVWSRSLCSRSLPCTRPSVRRVGVDRRAGDLRQHVRAARRCGPRGRG